MPFYRLDGRALGSLGRAKSTGELCPSRKGNRGRSRGLLGPPRGGPLPLPPGDRGKMSPMFGTDDKVRHD
jgi:hypothetical protein